MERVTLENWIQTKRLRNKLHQQIQGRFLQKDLFVLASEYNKPRSLRCVRAVGGNYFYKKVNNSKNKFCIPLLSGGKYLFLPMKKQTILRFICRVQFISSCERVNFVINYFNNPLIMLIFELELPCFNNGFTILI